MVRRRVVITGLGALTPIGLNVPESWQAVQEGRCGIGPITQFDPGRGAGGSGELQAFGGREVPLRRQYFQRHWRYRHYGERA